MKTNIFIATPCYSGRVTIGYMESLISYITKTDISFAHTPLTHDSLVTRMRNWLFTLFYENMNYYQYTHILWQDDDVAMNAEGLISLLSHDADVIGPAVPLKSPITQYGMICAVGDVYDQVGEALYKADFLGTGTMLMSAKAVKDIVSYCNENDAWYWDAPTQRKVYDVFKVGASKSKLYLSEDWYVCETLREIGYEIYIDGNSEINHAGYYKPILPINPESVGRKYRYEIDEPDRGKFWTPNDWIDRSIPDFS